MKLILIIWIFFEITLQKHGTNSYSLNKKINCTQDAFPPPDAIVVPQYTINLDLPPESRWDHIIKAKKKDLARLVDHVENLLIDLFGMKIFTLVNSSLPELTNTFPHPFREEINGIAKSSGLTVSQVTLYNIFYEVFSMCTSIIVEDDSGHILHGRNLDFGLFMGWDRKNHTWIVSELLRPLVMDLRWMKGGKLVYSAATYAGYLGVITAIKKGKFSFSLDERFVLNGGYVGLLEWILFKDYNQSWIAFLTRQLMEDANSYDEALKLLTHTRLLAPAYFILAGTKHGQGVIITRGRKDFDLFSLWTHEKGEASWFLVQTNYDHWKSPPFYDDRRTPAASCLQESGRANVSMKLLYNVLSTKPVLNKLTTYTTLMSGSKGFLKTWLRSCPDPCWPW